MSPRGRPLTQARVTELAAGPGPLIVCGRFEGVDQRVIDARGLEEVSVGDYVLSGGEIAALVLIDACVRLLPGVMGKEASGPRRAFPKACWNTRNTPGRRCSRAGPSRKSSRPATTPRSRPGGGRNPRLDPCPAARPLGGEAASKSRQKTRQKGDKRL